MSTSTSSLSRARPYGAHLALVDLREGSLVVGMSSPSGPVVQTPSSAAVGFSAMSLAIERGVWPDAAKIQPERWSARMRWKAVMDRLSFATRRCSWSWREAPPRRSHAGRRGDAAGDRGHPEPHCEPDRAALPFAAAGRSFADDAVIVTHRHRDRLDGTAEELLPRDVPVFCQPEDEEALRRARLDARPVAGELEWDGLRVVKTPGRHGIRARWPTLLAPSAASCSTSSTSPETRSDRGCRGDDRAPPAAGRRRERRRRRVRGRAASSSSASTTSARSRPGFRRSSRCTWRP